MGGESDVPFDSEADGLSELSILGYLETRRKFIKQVAGTSAAIAIGPNLLSAASVDQAGAPSAAGAASDSVKVNLKINGRDYAMDVDPRVTLLDALRERLPSHRLEEGMRPRPMWRVHGVGERAAHQFLPQSRRYA
jgi:xanthine dehydrogenase YagT iron-sulfur-binding subunit